LPDFNHAIQGKKYWRIETVKIAQFQMPVTDDKDANIQTVKCINLVDSE